MVCSLLDVNRFFIKFLSIAVLVLALFCQMSGTVVADNGLELIEQPQILGVEVSYDAQDSQTELELAVGLNLLFTDAVHINGRRLGYFLVDTGANSSIISPDLAKSFDLQVEGGLEIKGQARGFRYKIDTLTVGPLVLRNYSVGTLDLQQFQLFSKPVVGILGADVLGHAPYTIDYRKQTLTIHDPDRFEEPKSTWSSDIIIVNHFRQDGRIDVHNPVGSPAIRGKLNSDDAVFMIDSGMNRNLSVTGAFAIQSEGHVGKVVHPLLIPADFNDGGNNTHFFEVNQAELFGQKYQDIYDATVKVGGVPRADESHDAIVGGMILRDYRLTIDTASRRIWANSASLNHAIPQTPEGDRDVDRLNFAGVTSLMDAARFGDTVLIQSLLKSGADLSIVDKNRNTILHATVLGGSEQSMKLLLEHEKIPSVDSQAANSSTPLMLASLLNRYEHCALLLDRGASVDQASSTGRSAIHFASESGCLEIVELLLDHGADMNLAPKGIPSPIILAAAGGHSEIVYLLANREASLTYTAGAGQSLTHAIAYGGNSDLLRWAIKVLPDRYLDQPMHNGVTPMMIAAEEGHADLVTIFICAGTDPAATAKKNPEFGRESAIHLASAAGHSGVLAILLEHDISPDQASGAGLTPMMLVAAKGDLPSLKLLLKHGAKIQLTDHFKMSALHYACKYAHPQLVAALIEAGADVSLAAQQNIRPLDLVSLNGDVDSARLLLQAGADPFSKGLHGHRAIDLAKSRGHEHLIDLFDRREDRP